MHQVFLSKKTKITNPMTSAKRASMAKHQHFFLRKVLLIEQSEETNQLNTHKQTCFYLSIDVLQGSQQYFGHVAGAVRRRHTL